MGLTVNDPRWKKYYPYFKASEFACKGEACKACGIVNVNEEFLDKLLEARLISNVPYSINSGCRCIINNRDIGSSDDSDHVTSDTKECKGVDIITADPRRRFHVKRGLYVAGFRRIGDGYKAKKITHAGWNNEQPDNKQCVEWDY